MNAPTPSHLLQPTAAGQGIGQRVQRKEDQRLLLGRGQYVGDIRMPDMLDVAFVRAPLAHARIRGMSKPAGCEAAVYTMADLAGVQPIVAASALAGFKRSAQWPLAHEKVRHVGELVAACVAPTRARAEDIAAAVEVDYEDLPVLADMHAAMASATRLHDDWADNVFAETRVDVRTAQSDAPTRTVRRQLRTARQCMMPLEGRAVLCWWDHRLDQLVMYSAAQLPHINRTGLAECLGLDQGQVRVISPDVGGGFGYKGLLLPEEICCAWLARHLGRPVRWLEDRREQLGANANCREHAYDIAVEVEADGRLVGIECDAVVDSGAYSSYPFSACLEAAQVGSILPGPYRMDWFRCRTRSAATNKPPILPYRGVARTGVCFALELMLDAAARELGIEPHELRRRSLVPASAMPYTNITNKLFDSGDYQAAMDRAVAALGWDAWRARQREAHAQDGGRPTRRLGLGLAVFCEQGAHGTSVYHGWGIPMVPGYEQCAARFTPDGVLELRLGAHSHGQGMETSMAQVAHSVLGIPLAQVRLVHGDTAQSPYSTGTWGSRCAVMSGGAVGTAAKALAERMRAMAAVLLDAPADTLRLEGGRFRTADGAGALTLAEIARTWYRAPQKIPPGIDPGGLEIVVGYKTQPDTGTFSYACHACAVEVDTATGQVRLLDYAICEDGGVLLNPMIVEGQLIGGLAQGIGTALYEEMPFDAEGQPLASTLADYLLPGAGEMPPLKVSHMETPSPHSLFGQKGIGEGGAIAPPAAIINAVNDALSALGAELTECPASPERVLAALAAVRTGLVGAGA